MVLLSRGSFVANRARVGLRVAVVGAGPGGLATAASLRAVGHVATLYGPQDDGPSSCAPTGLWSPGLRALAALDHRAVTRMADQHGAWVTRSGVRMRLITPALIVAFLVQAHHVMPFHPHFLVSATISH
jgi:2-polyprenyl-6-methoxyphenol hydroxylase-like FAD-dependent oxidoreductase